MLQLTCIYCTYISVFQYYTKLQHGQINIVQSSVRYAQLSSKIEQYQSQNNTNSHSGLTKKERREFKRLSRARKKGLLMVDSADLEYMVSTAIIKISQTICDFDIDGYDTDDLLKYMHRIQPDRPHNYPIGAMKEHIQKFLFYRLKQIVDFVWEIGLSYHRSFYEVIIFFFDTCIDFTYF